MVAPFPRDFIPGRSAVRVTAQALCGHYGWIARWSNEMQADGQINLKKLGHLIVHCQNFRRLFADLRTASTAIRSAFHDLDIDWPDAQTMWADLEAVRQGAETFQTWAEATYPQARTSFATIGFNQDYSPTETVLTVPKTQASIDQVSALRALFGVS